MKIFIAIRWQKSKKFVKVQVSSVSLNDRSNLDNSYGN